MFFDPPHVWPFPWGKTWQNPPFLTIFWAKPSKTQQKNMFLGATPGKTIAKTPHFRPFFPGLRGEDHLRRSGRQQRRRAALRGVCLLGHACLDVSFRGGKLRSWNVGGLYLVVHPTDRGLVHPSYKWTNCPHLSH